MWINGSQLTFDVDGNVQESFSLLNSSSSCGGLDDDEMEQDDAEEKEEESTKAIRAYRANEGNSFYTFQ